MDILLLCDTALWRIETCDRTLSYRYKSAMFTTNCNSTRYNKIQLRGPGECNRRTKMADYRLSSHENKCESR